MGGADRPLLRCIACGSVDDGKSTLIGRLLQACGQVPDDQLAALGEEGDVSLLLDGLEAEREQGITIDVAYRSFETASRRFILADAPGHEHYTRNMVTAASRADLAIVLVDARNGVVTQTRRHSLILSMLSARAAILAVNKMDLVGYDQAIFERIVADYAALAHGLDLSFTAIPLSAKAGDNVGEQSSLMPWHDGPSLAELLDTIAVAEAEDGPLRLPVQLVTRDEAGARLLSGMIASGGVRVGDAVRVMPSGATSPVARIVAAGREVEAAQAGEAVMLQLAEQVDCARGDVIAAADSPPEVADQFEANLAWLDEAAMIPGRSYALQLGPTSAIATISALKHAIDVESGSPKPARTLAKNEAGLVTLSLDRPIAFEPYARNRDLGGFILIDRETNATAGAGMIQFALRRSHNIAWQELAIDREARAARKAQVPRVVWLTGRPGAGKSTIADSTERLLHARGFHTYVIDGDNLRHGLTRDLGFTPADRVENIRRAGEVAKLMWDAGLVVLCAFVSPYRADRRAVRELFPDGAFVEVFVDASLEEAMRRDPKGLYAKAARGEVANLTGLDSPYEPPEAPDLHLDTASMSPEEAAERIVRLLDGRAPLGSGPQ